MSYRDALNQLSSNGVLADRRVASEMAVGLDKFSRTWTEEILPFIATGGSELRFIEAPYGRGKTHFVQHLSTLAEAEGFLICHAICGVQLSPFQSLEETYRAVAKSMMANIDGIDVVGLDKILVTIDNLRVMELQDAPRINPAFRNLAIAHSRMRRQQLREYPGLADLRALLMGDTSRRVVFRDLYRSIPSISRPLGKLGRRNAGSWLRSLFSLPRLLGFKGFALFFDESGADMHYARLSRQRKRQHLSNLRILVDHMAVGSMPGAVIVYAVTHDLLEHAARDYPALAQRISRVSEQDEWNRVPPNPRAIWSQLDHLTIPARSSRMFYQRLLDRLVEFARKSDIQERRIERAQRFGAESMDKFAGSIESDVVRIFVKEIAGRLLART